MVATTRPTIGFVLEQTLGHVTHSQNLLTNIPRDPSIVAQWGLVEWQTNGLTSRLPLYGTNWTVRAGWRARRQIAQMQRRSPLDALFVHTQVAAVLMPDLLKRLPTVVSLDATPQQYDALGDFYGHATGTSWMEAQKWRLNQQCYRLARHLVTWSQWTKESLISDYGVEADTITVIPPGVNPDEWICPVSRDHRTGAVKLLFVGANLARKGGDLLLETFGRLRDAGLPVELHLVTRDTVAPAPGLFVYNDMAPNSHELKALYHKADIFCLPTLGDCLPMVLSEAGAAGLPLIATDVGAIGEIVRDGESGFLIPVGDGPALEEAVSRLVKDRFLRLKLGVQAMALVQEQYDAQVNAGRLVSLLRDIAGDPAPVSPVHGAPRMNERADITLIA